MMLTFLNSIADWNPQLFREFKGRLKSRTLTFAIGISLIIQAFICFLSRSNKFDIAYAQDQLKNLQLLYANNPKQAIDECSQQVYCLIDSLGNLTLNWDLLWQDFGKQVFLWLSLFFVPVLLVGGVYMLVNDLSQEEQRGTLNFIRLSPQKSESILTGKVLGVPILLYLGIILSLPLHLWTAHLAGISIGFVLCFYSLLGIISFLFYNISILYVLIGGTHAWLAGSLVFIFNSFYFPFVNFLIELELNTDSSWKNLQYTGIYNFQWFNLPLGQSLVSLYGFVVISLGLVCFGIWQVINRKFRNPNATILSKKQSYIATACFQGWVLGLIYDLSIQRSEDQVMTGFLFLFIMSPLIFFTLIAALSPHRQMLQDWARYSHTLHPISTSLTTENTPQIRHYSRWKDLVQGEKSPAVVAIFLNLLITAVIWIPWIITGPQEVSIVASNQSFYKLNTILGFLLSANFMLICSLVVQLILMMKTAKRSLLAVGSIGMLVGLPFVIFTLFSISPETNPIPWLFSMFPFVSIFYAGKMSICLAILAQWTVQGLLGWQLIRQLQRAGESTSKALLESKT